MGEIGNQMKSVSFTRMADGTDEEYAFLTPLYEKCRSDVSDRLLELLKSMKFSNLYSHLVSKFCIQVGKWFIHQTYRIITDYCPCQCNSLPLTS